MSLSALPHLVPPAHVVVAGGPAVLAVALLQDIKIKNHIYDQFSTNKFYLFFNTCRLSLHSPVYSSPVV